MNEADWRRRHQEGIDRGRTITAADHYARDQFIIESSLPVMQLATMFGIARSRVYTIRQSASCRQLKRTGRCVCGIKVAYHFDHANRKLSCDEARRIHPRAHRRSAAVRQMFMKIVPKGGD